MYKNNPVRATLLRHAINLLEVPAYMLMGAGLLLCLLVY